MLLTIDVRNKNITLGIFDQERLVATFRITTEKQRTSDEYGLTICNLLEHRNVEPKKISAVIISSVVPDLMHSLINGIIKYFHVHPIVVSAGVRTGIRIATENPKEVGADRIVDAVAAYHMAKGAVIVVDFGAATTFDLVGPKGTFEAAITAPGIETAARSLWAGAAMLPAIEIKKPKTILAKDTITSMQAGLFFGAIGQIEYIVNKLKEESGYENITVIATGGLGNIVVKETTCIDKYWPNLTLEGLRIIYNKNRK